MGGIGIIHNPFAKGNLKRPWIADEIRKVVGDKGMLRETKNINELPEVALEFKKQGIDVIAVNGGDGSLHLVLSAFVNAYGDDPLPRLMSLRGGTMNTVSNSLKIKGKTLKIVKNAVKAIDSGEHFHEVEQHLIKINDKYGFLSGAGVIASFLDAYYSGAGTGPSQAAKLVVKMVTSALTGGAFTKKLFSPAPFKIKVAGEYLDQDEFIMLVACTVREVGLGVTPTPRAYDKPGHFHLIASNLAPVSWVPQMPGLWMGKDLSHPLMHYNGPASDVVIEPRERIKWMVDGELYDTEEPLHFSGGPTIKIVAPPAKAMFKPTKHNPTPTQYKIK